MKEVKEILNDLKKGIVKPVYVLDGEEAYYIDKITDEFEEKLLQAHERDFNLSVLYGKDSTWADVVNACRSYPAFAERRLVILKEAAQLKDLQKLDQYIQQPTQSTVLIIAHKYGKVDGRSSMVKTLKKTGGYYTFNKVRDYEIKNWILNYCSEHQLNINDANANLLGAYLGTDLQKIVNELQKLVINLKPGEEIKAEHIEKYIGISKEYNIFEYPKALLNRNAEMAFKIANHFTKNPKDNPLVVIVANCYAEFAKLYQLHYLRNSPDAEIASKLGTNPYFIKDYKQAATYYNLKQTVQAILLLQEFNLNAIGVGTTTSNHNLLKEYTAKILSL